MAIDSHDELLEAYLDFFKTFQTDDGDFKYVDNINRMIREGERSLTVQYDDLVLMDDIYDLEISTTLTENPAFTIEIGSEALSEQVRIENPDYHREVTVDQDMFSVRFANPPTPIQIRDLRANHTDSIRWLEGIVIRTTEIKSIITEAVYYCTEPNQHRNIMIFRDGIYSRPDRCFVETCKAKDFVLDPRESKMIDWQMVTLQEKPEALPPGASPKSLPCRLIDDVVNTVRPGDRIQVGGLVRTRPTKVAKKGQILTYDIWIDVNYIESLTKEDEFADISLEEEKIIRELAQDPKIHDRLLESVAPAIYGMDKIKEATLLMLFGGVDKVFPDGFTTRGQSNLLLVGDPGTAKSQLLRYTQGIAPRGLYTSGRGSSAAGLTAAIIRDPDTGEISLEAGALVLADRGICVSGDTQILLDNGDLCDIKTIVECEFRPNVLSFDSETYEVKSDEIEAVSSRFSSDVFELKFSTGDMLKVTKEHPLPTWDNGVVWKTVEKIVEGDIVIDFRSYPLNSKGNNISPDFAEFLGLICSDGSLSKTKYQTRFYTKSIELETRYHQLVESLFQVHLGSYTDKRSGVKHLYISNKEIHTNLIQLGIPNVNKSKTEIRIPLLFSQSNETIKSFFVGLINGDGSISNRIGGGIIDIIVGNKKSAEFYQQLLRRIGCISRISSITQKGGGVVPIGNYQNYKLSITGIDNIKKLKHENLTSYKLQNLEQIINRRDLSEKIYKIDALIRDISDKLPHSKKRILYKSSVRKSTLVKQGLTRVVLKKVVKELANVPEINNLHSFKELQKILENHLYFMKLVSKTKTHPQKVYNIQVSDNQTYFANFIPVHNCMIDEFDKMNENDRSAIHEGMEQHTISIAKAGIVATLNARTGVFAAANPKFGRYEPHRTFSENVNLSPAILSRFDLVFIIRDEPEIEKDQILANHILKLHQFHGTSQTVVAPITEEMLKKYIAFAKTHYNPTLTEEATEVIESFYVNMRSSVGRSNDGDNRNRVTITARQLEGIIRMAEARARAGLRNTVTKHDALKAIELMNYSLSQIAIDPTTGEADIDGFYSGQTSSKRSKLTKLLSIVDFLYRDAGGKPFEEELLLAEAENEGITREYTKGVVQQMLRDGQLYQPKTGWIKRPDS
ncbi:MAG: hypothetical protein GPJ54_19220 [Candidatus Heimdallarchaeota archaeon]|nr:hypothetical protein [Candidatus Heimdallarchaeota archaeon]